MAVSCDPSRCQIRLRAKERQQTIEMAFCAWFFPRRKRLRLVALKSKAKAARSPRRSKPGLKRPSPRKVEYGCQYEALDDRGQARKVKSCGQVIVAGWANVAGHGQRCQLPALTRKV